MGSEKSDGFSPMFPSPTAGDGRVRRNSARTGAGQGAGGTKAMTRCKQCGFPFDANAVDTGGGSQKGDGGLGGVTKTDNSATLDDGTALTAEYGDRTVSKGAGCPHCGTKHGAA